MPLLPLNIIRFVHPSKSVNSTQIHLNNQNIIQSSSTCSYFFSEDDRLNIPKLIPKSTKIEQMVGEDFWKNRKKEGKEELKTKTIKYLEYLPSGDDENKMSEIDEREKVWGDCVNLNSFSLPKRIFKENI